MAAISHAVAGGTVLPICLISCI